MKNEHPILFSGEMVRAILEGQKTQTRRAMKRQPCAAPPNPWRDGWSVGGYDYFCPYGQPGARLWVKETWATVAAWDKQKPSDLSKTTPIYYHADKSHGSLVGWHDEDEERGRLRPSIFMCRWISRITMEITGVRVERLRDISEADAKAEGVIYSADPKSPYGNGHGANYRFLLESINGRGSWAKNPWVWVIEFRKL